MKAIVYTSNTGTTEQYAKLLGGKIGLPVYPLKKANLPAGSEIIYLGWVMAGSVKGYKKAAKKFKVRVLCGVCMAESGSQLEELRKTNNVPQSIPVFTMQGGFDLNRLHGVYKLMMTAMRKSSGESLSKKPNHTAEEDDMLDMLLHGANRVSEENLKPLLDWLASNP